MHSRVYCNHTLTLLVFFTGAFFMQLHEQYRPRAWHEVVGQDKVIQRIEALKARSLGGRAYFLTGPSGAGKTTIGRLIASEVADELFIDEIDASDLTPATLREIERTMHTTAWGKGGRAYLINEAHGLRRDTIRQLLVLLERLPSHVVVIFTTTNDGQQCKRRSKSAALGGLPMVGRKV